MKQTPKLYLFAQTRASGGWEYVIDQKGRSQQIRSAVTYGSFPAAMRAGKALLRQLRKAFDSDAEVETHSNQGLVTGTKRLSQL